MTTIFILYCTNANDEEVAYKLTSPSICLQSLNPEVYGPVTLDNLYGYCYGGVMKLENALAVYRDLEFDRRTGWSRLLESLMVSGTIFFNPDRTQRTRLTE